MNIKIFPFLLYSLSVLCFFEVFARYGFILFPYEDHQRYGHTKSNNLIKNLSFRLKINGRSAIGALFKGEKIQVAFFGTSTLFYGVPMNKTWPELLRQSNDGIIHVDNFGMYDESTETLLEKLDSLCSLKRFYDISIVQLSHITREPIPAYHHRFKPYSNNSFQTYQQIKKWYNRHRKTFRSFEDRLYYFNDSFVEFIVLKGLQSNLLKELFINHEYDVNKNIIYHQNQLVSKIIDKAYCISKTVFWITEPIAWSENMLNSYKKIPLVMRNINKNDPSFIFANHKSLGRYMIKQKNIIKNIVKEQNQVILIDSHDFIKKEISKNPNLFIYLMHLSEEGHELMFSMIYPFFLEHLPKK